MIKLYGHPMSTCSRKVLLTLAEKGAPFEFNVVDLMKGEQKQPAHLARQPFGVVPAIQDGDFELYESRAIIRYLDARLPGASLVPSDLESRARMDQWMLVEQCYFSPPAMKAIMNKLMSPAPDAAVIEAGLTGAARALDEADKRLGAAPYFAGQAFSLADISWMPYVGYLFAIGAGDQVTSRKNVAAWWGRVSERPSWKKVNG